MHILFDADGTFLATDLLDAKKLGVDATILTEFFVEKYPPTVTGDADLTDILPPYLERMGWKGTLEEFLEARFTSQVDIREGMRELLGELRRQGHICSLCTQQEINRSNYMRREMGFEKMFDALYFTAELGYAKKNNKFYEQIIEKSGLPAHETLFIDDKKQYCDAGKAVGMQVFHFHDNIGDLKTWLHHVMM